MGYIEGDAAVFAAARKAAVSGVFSVRVVVPRAFNGAGAKRRLGERRLFVSERAKAGGAVRVGPAIEGAIARNVNAARD